MGLFKIFFVAIIPAFGASIALSFRLGHELPKASRKLGQRIGMSYNYFKVILKLLSPQSTKPAEAIEVMRKANQQAQAFSRELKTHIAKSQLMMKEVLPKELSQNPLDNFGLKPEQLPKEENKLQGAELIDSIYKERKRIIEKKRKKKEENQFYDKI